MTFYEVITFDCDMSFLKSVIDVIYPPLCSLCGVFMKIEQEPGVCPLCLSQMKYIASPLCNRCGKPFHSEIVTDHLCGECLTRKKYLGCARSVGYYDGVLRKAIHLLKYKLKSNLAVPLGNIMANQMHSFFSATEYHLILPVPLHPRRLRERGFNQALALARVIGKKYRINLDNYNLTRHRETKPQVGLSQHARKNNVKDAFSLLKRDRIIDKNVLLVDDVYTSGNTVEECAKVLVRAGAHKADVLTLARV
jgi:ComF family protein